jgi:hypothetical protein
MKWRRVILKALALYALANILFAYFNPPVQKFSLYNNIFPGRDRFQFGGGYVNYEINIDEVDALFAQHVISGTPKADDELRVVVLGDSSVWGELLRSDQTLPAQLNNANLKCGEKSIRFYNLGYPHPIALKDLIILNKALEHDPDFVLWMISLNALRERDPHPFIYANTAQAEAIIRRENLDFDLQPFYDASPSFWGRTLIGQRERLARLFDAQLFGLYWASGIEYQTTEIEPTANDLPDAVTYSNLEPGDDIMQAISTQWIDAGNRMAGDLPLLLVNQPMFIANGENSDLRYNTIYPRWAYDRYREIIARESALKDHAFLDLWDAIPPSYFTDTPMHLTAEGEQVLAKLIAPEITAMLCR